MGPTVPPGHEGEVGNNVYNPYSVPLVINIVNVFIMIAKMDTRHFQRRCSREETNNI
jgi:hypothetical protein